MSVIYRTIEEPTDIYVAGCYFDTLDKCLLVDEDYISVEVRSNGDVRYIETDGSVYVATEAEMIKLLKECNVPAHDGDLEFVVVRGFKGNILLKGFIDANEVLTKDNFDRTAHLYHELYAMVDDEDRFPEISYYLEFEGESIVSPIKNCEELYKLV